MAAEGTCLEPNSGFVGVDEETRWAPGVMVDFVRVGGKAHGAAPRSLMCPRQLCWAVLFRGVTLCDGLLREMQCAVILF